MILLLTNHTVFMLIMMVLYKGLLGSLIDLFYSEHYDLAEKAVMTPK